MGEHAGAEAVAHTPGHAAPDRAEPDDADGERAQLAPAARAPVAGARRLVGRHHVAQRGEHERDRVVGHGVGVGARRARHHHAALGRGAHVDRVDARAEARDHPQPRRAIQVRGGDRPDAGDPPDGVAERQRVVLPGRP